MRSQQRKRRNCIYREIAGDIVTVTRIGIQKRKNVKAAAPSVGIMYVVRGKLLIDATPLAKAGRYGDFAIHERAHIEYWAELVRAC